MITSVAKQLRITNPLHAVEFSTYDLEPRKNFRKITKIYVTKLKVQF